MLLFITTGLVGCNSQIDTPKEKDYGAFIGANREDLSAMFTYDVVVIDAAYYEKEDIETLHQNKVTVYSYLNVGSIETFRDSYFQLSQHVLGAYENWPDEYWMDVSEADWQIYIAEEANKLIEKGVDGFFLDNVDVYYYYPRQEIFDGLVHIFSSLEQYGKDVLVNGGDAFITEALFASASPLIQISGVNQECVFTNIDFEKNTLSQQDEETSQYYIDYLQRCKEGGLDVYIIEYGRELNESMLSQIKEYCMKNGFQYYIAPSMQLEV